MQKFMEKIVGMMKSEKLFEPQGGPIIMSQIENEYGPIEWEIGTPGKAYTKWAAKIAVGLNTGVPWIMCKQDDTPDPLKGKDHHIWSGPVPYRPVEDLAFSVARFIQNNGSFVNYYMYHGGTNFGRTGSELFITTSYDFDAPLDEYGLMREPKWGHLRDLHKAIKQCEPTLLSAYPTVGLQKIEVHEFKLEIACSAFLANYDTSTWAKVTFRNMQYDLPPWSISILPDCKNSVFNTAKVNAPRIHPKMTPVGSGFSWESYNEETVSADDSDVFTLDGLIELINLTRDASDSLWYTTNVNIKPDEGFFKSGTEPTLTVMPAGHSLHVFINGQSSGTVHGSLGNPKLTFSDSAKLRAGVNKISLLNVAVGLPNVGVHYETWNTGVLGPVKLKDFNEGARDLGKQKWSCKVGLKGEGLKLDTLSRNTSVEWVQGSLLAKKVPLTWYKTTFNAPEGNEPLALDMNTMGKGQIWINGETIRRHWPAYIAHGNCNKCSYTGIFSETKCQIGCGEPSQRWYYVPRSWLKPSGNFLVIFEEFGGDPSGISLVKRTT